MGRNPFFTAIVRSSYSHTGRHIVDISFQKFHEGLLVPSQVLESETAIACDGKSSVPLARVMTPLASTCVHQGFTGNTLWTPHMCATAHRCLQVPVCLPNHFTVRRDLDPTVQTQNGVTE